MAFGNAHGSTYQGDGGGWETNAQERERERQDAITDAANEALAFVPGAGRYSVLCPGCEQLVHHSDTTAHARTCDALREAVTP